METMSLYSKPKGLKGPTRHLYIAGIGLRLGTSKAQVREFCEKYGSLDSSLPDPIEMGTDKGFCCVSFEEESDAVKAYKELNGKVEPITGRKLYIRYATIIEKKRLSPEPECTSLTDNVTVPGLLLMPDFIDEEEENHLVELLTSEATAKDWETGLARRVAHYGFIFDYETRGVSQKRQAKPLPGWAGALASRVAAALGGGRGGGVPGSDGSDGGAGGGPELSSQWLADQLTVNEYLPGQGIAYHVDTHSAFEEELISLTLNAGCTMEFRKPCLEAETAALLAEGPSEPFKDKADDWANPKAEAGVRAAQEAREATAPPNGVDEAKEKKKGRGVDGAGRGARPLEKKQRRSEGAEGAGGAGAEGCKGVGGEVVPPRTYAAHKRVWLGRRTLCVLTGEARYVWEHHIASRRTDKVAGQLLPRGVRYSLTFRRVRRPPPPPPPPPSLAPPGPGPGPGPGAEGGGRRGEGSSSGGGEAGGGGVWERGGGGGGAGGRGPPPPPCECAFPAACDAPWALRRRRARLQNFYPSKLEMENVHSIYESIAGHWNHTRGQRKVLWPGTKSFIESLPPGSLVADIGCGDGKYFGANPEAMILGCDRSQRLLDICVDKNQFEVICCDALKLPYQDNTFDAVICVAVLHHLSTEVHRINALKELVRITRPGGLIEIQVWAYEQEPDSRRKFDQPDCFVPWHLQRKYASAQDLAAHGPPNQNGLLRLDRYVHAFREGELRGLCARHLGGRARVVQPEGYARSNWHLRLQKT